MVKIFISYRFKGEDFKELEEILGNICNTLKSLGHEVFCSFWLEDFFKKNNYTIEQIYNHCLKELNDCEVFLPIIWSNNKSEGMLKESKKAIELRKKYILLIKKGLGFSEFKSPAHQVIQYTAFRHLNTYLKTVDFYT